MGIAIIMFSDLSVLDLCILAGMQHPVYLYCLAISTILKHPIGITLLLQELRMLTTLQT